MELGHTLEVWNCDYRKDAYADAWGQLQWGWVVLGRERIEVIGTMEGVEPYTNRHDPDYKTLARDSADRTYVSEPVIDYCGTRTRPVTSRPRASRSWRQADGVVQLRRGEQVVSLPDA
jgi:hypothetical protein